VRLTVQSSGGPYGRVMWESAQYATSRPSQTAAFTTLYLSRTEGSQGRLRVFYRYCQYSVANTYTTILTASCMHMYL